MDHRLTADNTCFSFSAHPLLKQPGTQPAEVIHNLERALSDVAALPPSPVVAFARQALAEYQRLNASDRLGSISAFVAYKLKVSHDDLMSPARNQHISFVRHVAVYVCRKLTSASFPELAAHFHRVNHTSALHSFNLIAKRVRTDPAFRRVIERIERDLSSIGIATAATA